MQKIKKDLTRRIVFGFMFALFALYALSIIIPVAWLILNTLKGADEYYLGKFFPVGFEIGNYLEAFSVLNVYGTNVVGMMINSIWYAVGGALLEIICSTCVAYCISKYRFWGRNLLSVVAIAAMIIPIVGALPSQYKVFEFLNMINSPLILLCMTSGLGMNYLVMLAAFDSLSWSYAEASFIDGAGHFKVFFRIMIPQVLPMISALWLISFIGIWNDYMSPLIFLPELPTLATGLYVYEAMNKRNMEMSMPVYFTGVVLCLIPVFVLFMIFRNTIMDMSLGGGVKE